MTITLSSLTFKGIGYDLSHDDDCVDADFRDFVHSFTEDNGSFTGHSDDPKMLDWLRQDIHDLYEAHPTTYLKNDLAKVKTLLGK